MDEVLSAKSVRGQSSCCSQHMMNVGQVSPFTCECGRRWMVTERQWQEIVTLERVASEVEMVLHAVFDEDVLAAHVRELYDGPPDDPVPGEPQPGRRYLDDMMEETRGHLDAGEAPDLIWLTGATRPVRASIQRGSPIVLCSEQEASLVRTLLRRHARMSEMTGDMGGSSGAVALGILERMGGSDVG